MATEEFLIVPEYMDQWDRHRPVIQAAVATNRSRGHQDWQLDQLAIDQKHQHWYTQNHNQLVMLLLDW